MPIIKPFMKQIVLSLHPLAAPLYRSTVPPVPFLCVVTPIFDSALLSIKGLTHDLQQQTFPDFIHVLISNGPSPRIKAYVESLRDERFIYISLKRESQKADNLLANVGKRKNYGMKHFRAERYVFIDADSKVIDPTFIAKLYLSHRLFRKDIIIAQIKMGKELLPKFPLYIGNIDLTNYTFSRRIELHSHYPTKSGLLQVIATANEY